MVERSPGVRERVPRASVGLAWLIAGIGLLMAAGCGQKPEWARLPRRTGEAVPFALRTVRFEGYRGADREFEVRAARAEVFVLRRIAKLEKVQIAFRDTGRGAMEVQAERAELDLARDDFVLNGQVFGQVDQQERFFTSEVRYDQERRRLTTDEPVRVERGSFVLKGIGMDFDVRARRLRIIDVETAGSKQ